MVVSYVIVKCQIVGIRFREWPGNDFRKGELRRNAMLRAYFRGAIRIRNNSPPLVRGGPPARGRLFVSAMRDWRVGEQRRPRRWGEFSDPCGIAKTGRRLGAGEERRAPHRDAFIGASCDPREAVSVQAIGRESRLLRISCPTWQV